MVDRSVGRLMDRLTSRCTCPKVQTWRENHGNAADNKNQTTPTSQTSRPPQTCALHSPQPKQRTQPPNTAPSPPQTCTTPHLSPPSGRAWSHSAHPVNENSGKHNSHVYTSLPHRCPCTGLCHFNNQTTSSIQVHHSHGSRLPTNGTPHIRSSSPKSSVGRHPQNPAASSVARNFVMRRIAGIQFNQATCQAPAQHNGTRCV